VNRDTVSLQSLNLQMERVRWRATLVGCQVVHQHLDGTLSLAQGTALGTTKMPAQGATAG